MNDLFDTEWVAIEERLEAFNTKTDVFHIVQRIMNKMSPEDANKICDYYDSQAEYRGWKPLDLFQRLKHANPEHSHCEGWPRNRLTPAEQEKVFKGNKKLEDEYQRKIRNSQSCDRCQGSGRVRVYHPKAYKPIINGHYERRKHLGEIPIACNNCFAGRRENSVHKTPMFKEASMCIVTEVTVEAQEQELHSFVSTLRPIQGTLT